MKSLRIHITQSVARLLAVPIKVREDFHRPEFSRLGYSSSAKPPQEEPSSLPIQNLAQVR
jgi:hypothetical protein